MYNMDKIQKWADELWWPLSTGKAWKREIQFVEAQHISNCTQHNSITNSRESKSCTCETEENFYHKNSGPI